MPKLRKETFGSGNQTWLASGHGLVNGRTYTLDSAKFAAIVRDKGFIPSGTPVAVANGKVAPWAGTGDFGGHILFDVPGDVGDHAVAVFWHGAVKKSKVPVTGGSFTPPTTQPLTQISYL